MTTEPAGAPTGPRSPRPPREYRPDLRPILILAALFVFVILGWLFLSPMILPPAR